MRSFWGGANLEMMSRAEFADAAPVHITGLQETQKSNEDNAGGAAEVSQCAGRFGFGQSSGAKGCPYGGSRTQGPGEDLGESPFQGQSQKRQKAAADNISGIAAKACGKRPV